MTRYCLHVVLLAFCATLQVFPCQRIVYINPVTGEDNPECLSSGNSSFPCQNLTWVFQQGYSDSTHYVLSEGQHYLTETTPPFQNLTSLVITGAGSAEVMCTDSETGLAFINVANITLQEVSFCNCSSLRNSTSRNFEPSKNESFKFQLYQFHVALYFYKCSDITMTSLIVAGSPNATAVAIYNTIGMNIIEHSNFTSNRLEDPQSAGHPGGGGIYVEFTFCVPGDDSCYDFDESIADYNSNSEYHFHNVIFKRNKASNLVRSGGQASDTHIVPFKRIHNSFGKGGGLAVVVKGNASNNSFNVSGCTFEDNEAISGSGLLIEYQDHSSSNIVSISDSTFLNNGIRDSVESTGGGIRVGHYVYDLSVHPDLTRNRMLISRCRITDNHALSGGGISVFPARQMVAATEQVFEMTIKDTVFTHNQAQLGAAIETTIFSLFTKGQLPSVTIASSRFLNNSIYSHGNKDSNIYEVGVGAVYSNGIPLHFYGDVVFEGNNGSGLSIVATLANFSNCNASFTDNRGKYGGAINILGAAFLVVNSFTSMLFERNEADVYGGAIANVFIERQNFRSYPNCFVHHDVPFKRPPYWGATLKFIDNSAAFLGSSIYTTSLHPCAWAGGSGKSLPDEILCWLGWEYIRNGSKSECREEINTDSGEISYGNRSTSQHYSITGTSLEVIPGKECRLPLVIKDDLEFGVEHETMFTAVSMNPDISSVSPRYRFLSGEIIQLDGEGGSSIKLQLNSKNERAWEVVIEVQLLECPPGYVPSHAVSNPPGPVANSMCVCSDHQNGNRNYQGLLHCSPEEAFITNGYWFGKINDTDELVASLCLPEFCHTEKDNSAKRLPNNANKLDYEICGRQKRTGILCGRCIDGFGPSVNTENFVCVECTNSSIAGDVVTYIASVYLPLFALFVFIIVFSVRLASGPANAFIFYAQFVSSTFDLNADSHIPINLISNDSKRLLQAYRLPYGIFNLDFLEDFITSLCFGTNLGTLDVLQLEYLIALFPLLMIIIMVLLVRIKDSHFFSCYRKCFKKPSWKFLRHWRANESLLHAFSAFLLLSYTKFSLTSSYIVNIHPFFNASGHEVGERRAYYDGRYKENDAEYNYRYRAPAIVVLIIIAVFPLMLFGYPVVWFEKCIIKVKFLWRWYPADKVQIFLDTFQGCYKDNRRYFAGMYFAFRLTINATYIIMNTWLEQFICQQVACTVFIFIIAVCWPYREEKWYVNYVDLSIFTNLAIVNALSLYLYVYAKINPRTTRLPHWPFIIQYVLVFLPLVYMVLYLMWYFLPQKQKEILAKLPKIPAKILRKRRKRKFMKTTLLGPSKGRTSRSTISKYADRDTEPTTTEITVHSDTEVAPDCDRQDESESEVNGSGSDNDMEAILLRAETENTYRGANKSSLTTPYQQWVQEARDTAWRMRGQYHSEPVPPRDCRNNLGVAVHAIESSGESGIQSRPTHATELRLSRRHSLGSYGSMDNQAEL